MRPPPGALLAWLAAAGADGLDNLTVSQGSDAGGGCGLFVVKTAVAKCAQVLKIPQSCVMTAGKAAKSDLGRACRALSPSCTNRFILQLWMAVGRLCAAHPFHAYLAGLPAEAPNATSWPENMRAMLTGTNVASAVEERIEALAVEFASVVPELRARHPSLVPAGLGIEALRWAHGMYTSRAFPSKLDHGNDKPAEAASLSDDAYCGVMLPLIDMANHAYSEPVEWVADGSGVTLRAGRDLAPGAEIFNNYGAKSNEQLLMSYGFALLDNVHDEYGLLLTLRRPAPMPSLSLGPFHIRRLDERWAQFPAALWRALNDPEAFAERSASAGTGDEGEVEVDFDSAEMLLSTLQVRLAGFAATAERDRHFAQADLCAPGAVDARVAFVARYRDGQRLVLEEGVASLEEMLRNEGGGNGVTDDSSEGGEDED